MQRCLRLRSYPRRALGQSKIDSEPEFDPASCLVFPRFIAVLHIDLMDPRSLTWKCLKVPKPVFNTVADAVGFTFFTSNFSNWLASKDENDMRLCQFTPATMEARHVFLFNASQLEKNNC